jgi:ATP-binding cassette subfamily B protein
VVVGAVHGRFTAGDVVLFLAAVSGVQGGLVGVVLQLGEAGTAVRLLRHYLDVVSIADELPSGHRTPCLRTGIELDDVWFRYSDDGPWVLRGVHMVIPAGRTVGLVGVNGAGKSTLVKLLCRFYDPQRGQIRWDGVDIRELDLAELRRRMSVTFQDFMAYDLTAAENVGLGWVDRIDDRRAIKAAAATAEIDHTLESLPRGYDTLLSRVHGDAGVEAGVTLSGGQWQRVALARTLVRTDADLLILDEPTAGLDAEGEHHVHATLQAHAADRTRLLISHRLAAIRDADLVFALSGGGVVEQGSHDDLMSADGEYARLFRLQAGGYQDARVTAS